MNDQKYAELKDFVIGLNDIEVYNLFEILIDEMNYRKIQHKNKKEDAD